MQPYIYSVDNFLIDQLSITCPETQMAYPPHASCYVVRTFFFMKTYIPWSQYQTTDMCIRKAATARTSWRSPPRDWSLRSVGRTMPPWLPVPGCRAWAGGDQVCLQTTLYALSQTRERLPRAEPWYKLQQRVRDVPYLHRGSTQG